MNATRPTRSRDERTDRMILEHQDYVRALAHMVARRLPPCVEVDDLIAYGQLGLIRAARLFDETRGVAFRTFAYPYIHGAIIDGLRQMCRGIPVLTPGSIRGASQTSPEEAGDAPLDVESLRSATESTCDDPLPPRVRLLRRVQRVAVACVLRLAQRIEESRRLRPDQIAELRDLSERVWRLVAELPAHQRVLLRMHYVEGRSFGQCARLLGRDKSRISRWHRDALERLRSLLSAADRRAACA